MAGLFGINPSVKFSNGQQIIHHSVENIELKLNTAQLLRVLQIIDFILSPFANALNNSQRGLKIMGNTGHKHLSLLIELVLIGQIFF